MSALLRLLSNALWASTHLQWSESGEEKRAVSLLPGLALVPQVFRCGLCRGLQGSFPPGAVTSPAARPLSQFLTDGLS